MSAEELAAAVNALCDQYLAEVGQEGRTIVNTDTVVDMLLDIKATLTTG